MKNNPTPAPWLALCDSPVGRLATCGVVAILSVTPVMTPVYAQQIQVNPRGALVQQRVVTGQRQSQQHSPVLIEPTAPIANLFLRAEDGVQRQDWKFAIDSLQRIVDTPEGSLVERPDPSVDGVVRYESARRQALRRLAALSSEGRHAYRLLFDGKAKRLFEQGCTSRDPKPLRTIVDRYPLSGYGLAAADVLASWAIDAGRPGEAVKVLSDVLELVSPGPAEQSVITPKLAAAYSLLGRREDASAVLKSLEAHHGASDDVARDVIGDVPAVPAGRATRNRSSMSVEALATSILELRPAVPSHGPSRGAWGQSWPMVGGSPARCGWMPPVEPTLSNKVPWRCRIPGATEDTWRLALRGTTREFGGIRQAPAAPGGGGGHGLIRLPVGQLVTDEPDGRRIFARTPEGCMALRAEDLSIEWVATPGSLWQIDPRSMAAAITRPGPQLLGDPPRTDAGIAFEDYIAGRIAYASGRVFMISHEGRAEYTLADRDASTTGLLSWIPHPDLGPKTIEGSRILAFDVDSGALVWQRGRTGHRDDPLGHVQFGGLPIPIGDALWLPYLDAGDLRLAVIDPRDGALIRSILLCSLGPADEPLDGALPLAYADGLVFVPTGRGVLFAVDSIDFSVRWACRYDAILTDHTRFGSGSVAGWAPGPPIVSGGLVLLTPPGRQELLAFSAADGSLQWSASCKSCLYLIGADPQRVWAGGTVVSCLSLSDGKELWATPVDSLPTGQAVRTGPRIAVPTLDGLLSLNAATGETLGTQPLPPSYGPLGNLLSLGSSLYSINPSFIRKFPDVGQLYAATRQQFTSQAGDVDVAVRLAWLELLRGKPQEAFNVVKELATSPRYLEVQSDPKQRDAVAHVRVEVLLTLAEEFRKEGRGDQDILRLLEDANAAATDAHDRLRCGLAIANQLSVVGRYVDAFRRLWALGVGEDGDQMMPWSDHVRGRARCEIGRKLAGVFGELQTADLRTATKLASELRDEVGSAARTMPGEIPPRTVRDKDPVEAGDTARKAAPTDRKDGRDYLRAVAALNVLPEVSQVALFELAMHHTKHQRYEQAEHLFRQILSLPEAGPDPEARRETRIAAHMGLCRLYATLSAEGYASTRWLRNGLDTLESAYAEAPMPLSHPAVPPPRGNPPGSGRTVAQWVQEMRSQYLTDPGAGAEPDAHRGREAGAAEDRPSHSHATFELSTEVVWSVRESAPNDGPRLVGFVPAGKSAPGLSPECVVLHEPPDVLSCRRAEDGTLLWKAPLRLPGAFPDESTSRWGAEEDYPRLAFVDGMTAVFAGRDGLFGIGMATGRRLWARPFRQDPGGPTERVSRGDGVAARSPGGVAMASAGGLVAVTLRSGRLSLLRLLDGSTVWARDLLGEAVGRIWMQGGKVVTAGEKLERICVLDASDGRVLSRFRFTQPDPFNQLVDVLLGDGLVFGPFSTTEAEGVVAVDLATGETVWRFDLDKPLVHLFIPQDGYLGLGLLGGDVKIVAAGDGELLLERRVSGAHAVMRGTMVDGTLLLQPLTTETGVRSTALVAFDVATDSQVWRRDDVVPLWSMDKPLTVLAGTVPVMFREGSDPPGHPGRDRRRRVHRGQPPSIDLGSLNVRTGEGQAHKLDLAPSQGMTRGRAGSGQLTGDFDFYSPGVAVIGTDDGVLALRVQSRRTSGQRPGEF